MSTKRNILILLLMGALLFAACTPTAPPEATATLAPTAGSTVTQAPTQTEAAPGSEVTTTPPVEAGPTLSQANTAGLRTFVIVPEQSEASYEVQEKFLNQDLPVMAVGKTHKVEGEVQLNLNGKPTAVIPRVMVDLSSLTSDNNRRDQRIRQEWLESEKYPNAEFVAKEVIDGPESYTEGETVNFKLAGDLTIREVTRPVTFDVQAKLAGDTVSGTAKTQVLMKDFGFDPPDIAGVLTVHDGVTVTVNFTAKETQP